MDEQESSIFGHAKQASDTEVGTLVTIPIKSKNTKETSVDKTCTSLLQGSVRCHDNVNVIQSHKLNMFYPRQPLFHMSLLLELHINCKLRTHGSVHLTDKRWNEG